MENTNTLNFTTRKEYVTWRAEWRANYASISQQIREAKEAYKDAQRNDVTPGAFWRALANLTTARKHANELLAIRVMSKIKAGEQYHAQKEAACN